METPKHPVSTRPQTTIIGKSIVIKGELSCSEELYVDGRWRA
jgi:cytoskeletal protein CcmA (bactofilin family)